MKTIAFLNSHQYEKAAAAAREVIDLNFYELYYYQPNPSLSYQNLFFHVGEYNKEPILSFQSVGATGSGRLSPPPYGSSNVNPTDAIVNDYETKQAHAKF